MNAFHSFWSLDFRSYYPVNQALMILLRKRKDADNVKDFRPINIVHSFCKLLTKVLTLRLVPHMNNLVAPNQSAFICGRVIHDNFMAVRSSAKLLHAMCRASILLKVDIAKAFETVGWTFLLELQSHLGCYRHWIEWISMLLSSASTRIILSGTPGRRICHARGLRQGDPVSPLLFVLAMEALNALFRTADNLALLRPLGTPSIKFRAFLYADDLIILLCPLPNDIALVRDIL
jgi:hypothetical protein